MALPTFGTSLVPNYIRILTGMDRARQLRAICLFVVVQLSVRKKGKEADTRDLGTRNSEMQCNSPLVLSR